MTAAPKRFTKHSEAKAIAERCFGELTRLAVYHDRDGQIYGTTWKGLAGEIVPIFKGDSGYQVTYPGRRPLYRVRDFRSDRPVYVVKDEATADAIADSGAAVATTWLGDVGDLGAVDWGALPNDVIVLGTPDDDLENIARHISEADVNRTVATLHSEELAGGPDSAKDWFRSRPPAEIAESEARILSAVRWRAYAAQLPPGWLPVPLSDLVAPENLEPVWDGILFRGTKTMLAAREKTGKTTLVRMLVRECSKPDGGLLLGRIVAATKVLIVSEEGTGNWAREREDSHLPGELLVVPRPPMPNDLRAWAECWDRMARVVRSEGIGLVILDTWARLAPVESENDNVQMTKAAAALDPLVDAGAAVLIVHHQAKGGGSRGGTALPASTDTNIFMSRPRRERDAGDQPDDGTRIFDIEGRFDPPPRIIAVYDGSGYEVEAGHSTTSVRVSRRRAEILRVLQTHGPAQLGEILDRLPDGFGASTKTVSRDLADLSEQGQVVIVAGTGGANDPRVYAASPVLGLTGRDVRV